ncbi:hypothetical protein [Empedobacter stercoris]|uniref:hypothetical protein n=1 Tax=Empedobacter stercoris TaxID=1628248 RepID=UPI0039E75BE8
MNTNNEELKPLSFDREELKPLSLDNNQNINNEDDFVPRSKNSNNDIKNKDSNFVFFFGTASSGKSVILATMLYYMRSQAGVIRPKIGTPNTQEAEALLYDYFENISKGILPEGTVKDKVTRLDLVFEPNNKSKKVIPINLTFLEKSGENDNEIRRGGEYHSSIKTYLSANLPLTFILVTSYENAHKDDILINTFLNKLEKYEKKLKSVNIILVISKWDKSGSTDVEAAIELDNFVNERLPMTSQVIDTYGLNKTFYTIGEINAMTNRVELLNLNTAEVLSKWLYQSIAGYPLDYEGTFWERIKFSFTN